MNTRRLLYTCVLVAGMLSAAAVLLMGGLLAVRLSLMAKPSRHGTSLPMETSGDPRAGLEPEMLPDDRASRQAAAPAIPAPASTTTKAQPGPPASPTSTNTVSAPGAPLKAPSATVPPGPEHALPPVETPSHALIAVESATGSFFNPSAGDSAQKPELVEIAVPGSQSSDAIWGALGRDSQGRIWYGVSDSGGALPSAQLMVLDPRTCQSTSMGDVLTALDRLSLIRSGERQGKIHSRIVQAADGHLYFASMDESGESEDGSKLPTWGGHLWRLRLPEGNWEHLAATPEALIAVGCDGRWVYALGYFEHVLYQFDTQTGKLQSVRVGAVAGHVSRNLLVDGRGHAYVPRLQASAERQSTEQPQKSPWNAWLVEYDTDLREVARTMLENYADPKGPASESHGIVGLAGLADGSVVMVTHVGSLYHVAPASNGPAKITALGWFHPEGDSYTPCLFTPDGRRYVAGLGRRGKGPLQWITHDLTTGQSQAVNVVIADLFTPRRQEMGLYGSMTCDFQGRFYVAGRFKLNQQTAPMLVRIQKAP